MVFPPLCKLLLPPGSRGESAPPAAILGEYAGGGTRGERQGILEPLLLFGGGFGPLALNRGDFALPENAAAVPLAAGPKTPNLLVVVLFESPPAVVPDAGVGCFLIPFFVGELLYFPPRLVGLTPSTAPVVTPFPPRRIVAGPVPR